MALAAMSLSQAYAAGELTDVKYSPDPASPQKEITKIMLQFMDANYGISGRVDVSGITFSRRESTEVLYALPDPATDYAKLYLEFGYKGDTEPVTIVTDGIYTLHIPEGAVTTFSGDKSNAEINVDFTVSSNIVTPMTAYTLDPAAGEVEEISVIEIAFPESEGLDWFHNDLYGKGNLGGITLTDTSDSSVIYTAVKESFSMAKSVKVAFAGADGEKVTVNSAGTYLLTIPAKMFRNDSYSGDIFNEEITALYTIKGSGPAEYAGFISAPADGATVGRMSTLSVIFPAMPEGLNYPVSNPDAITILTPDGTLCHGISARLQSSDYGQYNTLLLDFGRAGDEGVINNAITFTAPGEYEVTIPAGVLTAYGSGVANEEIRIRFTVDPLLNFTYELSESATAAHSRFEPFTVSAGNSLAAMKVKEESGLVSTISLDGISHELAAADMADGKSVTFTLADEIQLLPGEWKVEIPAGALEGMDHEGRVILNHEPVSFIYTVREPEVFEYTIEPAADETVEFFKNISILFSGDNLRSVSIDPTAGTPVMTLEGGEVKYELTGNVSSRYVIFTVDGGVTLPDGRYTVTVPAGYILTTGADHLTGRVGEITTAFSVESVSAQDYTRGILFLNEGWYGHDTGSLNFYSNEGEWTYNAFLRNNPDHRLGITSQYGHCFGSRIYVVSKQSGTNDGITGGELTVLDASTLKFIGQITDVPDEEASPRAFCAWDEHKGYLSTNKQIYVVDLDKLEVTSVVPGTDIYTSTNSNGEMLRYGDRVFAIRQGESVDVIDPATEDVESIPVYVAQAFAVTPDGSLYVATRNESNEFVKISTTAPYEIVETFDIDDNKSKLTNIWSTWRKAPLAASTTENVVYYVTQAETENNRDGARHVARYDFDTRSFDPEFITLPGTADGLSADWILYGEGVSVNPADGRILLMAVEAGYGAHYKRNRVFVADPATGEILADETLVPEDAYWFPAMALYPDFDAPAIDATSIEFKGEEEAFILHMPSITTLATGNPHLINYTVTSTDGLCDVKPGAEPGSFILNARTGGLYGLRLSAEYQGKSTVTDVICSPSTGVAEVGADMEVGEVCDLSGVILLRNATVADIERLAPGVYIAGGRKYVVK